MVHNTLAQVFPDDGIVVLESPSSTLALRNQLRISKPGQLLLRRRRRPRLRPGRGARRPARPAGPAGRLRPRRGLGAVRDHRLLDGGRLRRPGHLPRPAQRGVLDPQVVRGHRGGEGRAGPRPAGARGGEGGRGLRGLLAGGAGRDELHAALEGAIGSGKPQLVEVPVTPGMACSRAVSEENVKLVRAAMEAARGRIGRERQSWSIPRSRCHGTIGGARGGPGRSRSSEISTRSKSTISRRGRSAASSRRRSSTPATRRRAAARIPARKGSGIELETRRRSSSRSATGGWLASRAIWIRLLPSRPPGCLRRERCD